MTMELNYVRGLLINPAMQTVCEVFVEPSWEGICYALGKTDAMFSGMVECFNLAQIPNRGIDAWMDEEANLEPGRPVFHMQVSRDGNTLSFAGSLLILDNDGDGESLGTDFALAKMQSMITWTNLETTGDFGPGREYTTDHPVFGKMPVIEGGKPVYRERA